MSTFNKPLRGAILEHLSLFIWYFGFLYNFWISSFCYSCGLKIIPHMCSAIARPVLELCLRWPSAWNLIPQSLCLDLLALSPPQFWRRPKTFLFAGSDTGHQLRVLLTKWPYTSIWFDYITLLFLVFVLSRHLSMTKTRWVSISHGHRRISAMMSQKNPAYQVHIHFALLSLGG